MSFSCKSQEGLSLTEILIVLAIVALLLVATYFVFYKQIFRAKDSKRKADLHGLTNILEDFYNNRGCYPQPIEVCYDPDGNDPCHICGDEAGSPNIGYDLPCNPDHPEQKYLYDAENTTCPQWYQIYTELAGTDDTDICPYGSCGFNPDYGYDYGVSSPNINLNVNTDHLYAYDKWGSCGDCGTEENCQGSAYLEIYGSLLECCDDHPNANSCYFYAYDLDQNDCVYCGNYIECSEQYGEIHGNLNVCCENHPGVPSCQ